MCVINKFCWSRLFIRLSGLGERYRAALYTLPLDLKYESELATDFCKETSKHLNNSTNIPLYNTTVNNN